MSKDDEPEISISPSVTLNPYQSMLNTAPALSMGHLMVSSSQALGSQYLSNAMQHQLNCQMAMATAVKGVNEIYEPGLADRDALFAKIATLMSNQI